MSIEVVIALAFFIGVAGTTLVAWLWARGQSARAALQVRETEEQAAKTESGRSDQEAAEQFDSNFGGGS